MAQGLGQIHGSIDFNGAGERMRTKIAGIHCPEIRIDLGLVGPAGVPAQTLLFVNLIEGIRARRIDDCQSRCAPNQSKLKQFNKGLAKAGDIAEVPARARRSSPGPPSHRLQNPIHDRLLAFEPKGIDAVDQIDAKLFADLLDALQSIVEIAGNLHRQRSMIERLGQLPVGDFAGANENDRPHGRWQRSRWPGGAGISRAGTSCPVAPTIRAWANAAVMPLSLKLPEGFIPSYCKYSEPGFKPT